MLPHLQGKGFLKLAYIIMVILGHEMAVQVVKWSIRDSSDPTHSLQDLNSLFFPTVFSPKIKTPKKKEQQKPKIVNFSFIVSFS